MALQKQPVTVNFAQGLDTKTDPNQLSIGKFLTLENSVFDVSGALTKRNGFAQISTLPDALETTLTKLNDNLIATGSNLYAFSQDTDQWLNQGLIQPIQLDVLPVVRVSTSQSSQDAAVASNGLTLITYIDSGVLYYQVSDSTTGQQIVSRKVLTNGVASPRAFVLGRYFIVTFIATVGGTHLQYLSIPITMPNSPSAISDIATSLTTTSAGYDGVVANNSLYLAWSDAATTVKVAYLTSTLVLSAPVSLASSQATRMSVSADTSSATPTIWLAFYDGTNSYAAAYDSSLNVVRAKTTIATGVSTNEITSVASNGLLTVLYEVNNNYASPYPTASVKTDYIAKVTVTTAGVVSSTTTILRSVGIASKAFIKADTGKIYLLATYGETNQPTYFLIDSSGNIYMRLAYANGGGYKTQQVLPSVSVLGDTYVVPYLIKDFLATVNKGATITGGSGSTPINAIYSQTGINLAKFTINTSGQFSSEIASALHLTGGQLWMYDSVKPVESGFHVWPENVVSATSGAGGLITAGTYNYVFTYEWTDNQGNLHRSAPSIPVTQVTTGATSTNTLYVPTLRLTYKVSPNPVRIVGYRWSSNQQVYYQFTSITSPTINDTTVDFVVITDTSADSAILGQTLLYTQGGVIENIAPPASTVSALFKNRLFLVDAEDRNLLWYSKQVIEAVPVEMSDLLTIYVAPTEGAQGSTGPITALSAMDDKLIIFKSDAIYYVTGTGPDNTGANNDFSDPIYITSSVGCANQASIVLMPNGIMFQSDKGIWLLGRDLSTKYIGADVEAFNSSVVLSAQSIPGTNQIRFILDSNITLLYDYYYNQWGTFTNLRAISSTLYQSKHTYLNEFGQVFQETEGTYLDGTTPVLMSFKTGPISVAGLKGYERFYFMYLLGTYFTPFKLAIGLSYDYSTANSQNIIVTPNNNSPAYGDDPLYGSGSPYGGPGNVFQARIFPSVQKCQTFSITMQEIYDSSLGVAAGQGLSLSGMNIVVGVKKGYSTQRAAKSFG